jgi:hypothetical protein
MPDTMLISFTLPTRDEMERRLCNAITCSHTHDHLTPLLLELAGQQTSGEGFGIKTLLLVNDYLQPLKQTSDEVYRQRLTELATDVIEALVDDLDAKRQALKMLA